jgi:tRNA(Ile)-lysidine synthase
MFRRGDRVGAAVSGGADSVCLLHVLRELAPRWELDLRVLHLNHHLRGEEANADARFVAELAARFGLACDTGEVWLDETENLEQAAREARLAFYRRAIDSGLVHRVATGHTRNDQAETVLFRFLRGAGTAGLAGIRPVTDDGIVRPLLGVTRLQAEQFLRERGACWRDDSTNASLRFARNRIRHELLPALEREWNPAIVDTLANTAEWALAEEEYWKTEIDCLQPEIHDGAVLLRADHLLELPQAVARRVIRRAIERVKGDLRGIDFRHVAAILDLTATREGHGRLQATGVDVLRSFEWLRIAPLGANACVARNYRFPLAAPGTTRAPNVAVTTELIENPRKTSLCDCVYNGEVSDMDWHRLSGSLELRNWRPGDQYQPVGYSGEHKIKTLFQENRIPLWERRHWPVITDGAAIVWSRRFGAAAHTIADSRSRVILRIRETK